MSRIQKDEVTLAISRVHNSSVALFIGKDLVFHIENERLSNIKHDTFPFQALSKIPNYVDHVDNLVLAGVSKTSPVESFLDQDLYTSMVLHLGKSFHQKGVTTYDMWDQHHKLHAACAFYNSGFDRALVVIKDGMGSEVPLTSSMFKSGTYGREIGTSFVASYGSGFSEISRHVAVNFDLPYQPFKINDTTYLSLSFSEGLAFQKIAKNFGFGELEAGKVMGMSSYGRSAGYEIYKDGLLNQQIFYYPEGDLRLGDVDIPKFTTFEDKADFAYDLQTQVQRAVTEEIIELIDQTGETNVCLSGGFFLNCVANYHIMRHLPEGVNLYVEPISSDAGTSIGAGKMFLHERETYREQRQTQIYLGLHHLYSDEDIRHAAKNCIVQKATPNKVASLIVDKKIVAIFQGRSESGPRALGNRSILYDPRDPSGKDHVNTVKQREWFRPFAGTVLYEHAHEWFDLGSLDESPFMMYAVDVISEKQEKIPAITHVDGTCRVQTLKRGTNPNYYALIEAFYSQTGIPIVFNTSFNLAGDCIVETLEDAINTLGRSDIDYLYLPEVGLLLSYSG